MADSFIEKREISENFLLRLDDLADGVKSALKQIPVTVSVSEYDVLVKFQKLFICGMKVEPEGYKIYNVSKEWADKTGYLCEESGDGTQYYYLETIDEVIGEVQRLVMFEAKKGRTVPPEHTSDLRRYANRVWFEKTYENFLAQVERNSISGKAEGSKKPVGIPTGKNQIDGASIGIHFGQGNPSGTPYINWWVVSAYYVTSTKRIVLGIEENRYPHIHEMKPLRYSELGNKKTKVAIFYEAAKKDLNYDIFYDKFITVSEEVMRLGLE